MEKQAVEENKTESNSTYHGNAPWIIALIIFGIILIIFIACAFHTRGKLLEIYESALESLENEQYEQAIEQFETIGAQYKDSYKHIMECEYQIAKQKISAGNYKEAVKILVSILGYKDSEQLLEECIK